MKAIRAGLGSKEDAMVAAHDVHGHFAQRDGYGWGVDAEELRRFFLEYEATIGFTSTFSAMLAAHAGVAMGSGPPANWDPYARIVQQITAAKRTYQTLQRMNEAGHIAELVTLWRLYGPRNGRTERTTDYGKDHLAEYAALLAIYTDAAHEARDEIVLHDSTRRADSSSELVGQSRQQACNELEGIFWSEARRITRLESEVAGHREGTKVRAAKQARIDAGWVILGKIVDAVRYDGTIRARIGAIEWTDREVTVQDAIRAKLDDPGKRVGKEAHAAWKEAKTQFVTAVRLEAHRLRQRAHEAYCAAKRGSS